MASSIRGEVWPKGKRKRPISERFWEKVSKGNAEECWPWLAAQTSRGYGWFIGPDGKSGHAHRFAWLLAGGEIPEGKELDHICRNRLCMNPAHLRAVSHDFNVRRTSNRSRGSCRYGHTMEPGAYYLWRSRGRKKFVCKICYNARRND